MTADNMKASMKLKIKKTPYLILGSFICLWFCIALIVLPKIYGPATMVKMEFGYWAHAADMAGMDWKEVVSLNTWYSFGYGLLMFPFMKLISNPIILYRCMVGVNFILLGICTLIVYKLLIAICGDIKSEIAAFIGGASIFYVSYITYAQTTIPEVLLTFLYLLMAYGLYRWFIHLDVWSGILVILTAGYMYTVHMRTVGIFLTTIACMAAAAFFRKEKEIKHKKILLITAIMVLTVILMLLIGVIKERAISSVASEQYGSMVSINDYSGQWEKIRHLCSLEGLYQFLTGFAGKVFYLGCAGFGLYYWGIAFLLKKAKELLTCLVKKETCSWKDWFFLWCLLSHISAVVISTIYWLGDSRLDGILYGRYHENTIPLIMAFGIAQLLDKPELRKRLLWFIVLSNILFFLIYSLVNTGSITSVNRDSVMGILYALDLADGNANRMVLYAYIFGGLGSILILGIVWLTDGGRRWRGLLSGICMLQLILVLYTCKNYTIEKNASRREDIELLWQVKQMLDVREEDEALYLYDDNEMSAYLAQYMLNDISLKVVSREELRNADRNFFVISQSGDEMAGELSVYYTEVIGSPYFKIYYNRFK